MSFGHPNPGVFSNLNLEIEYEMRNAPPEARVWRDYAHPAFRIQSESRAGRLTHQCELAGAGELDDAEALDEFEKSGQFAFVTGDLSDE